MIPCTIVLFLSLDLSDSQVIPAILSVDLRVPLPRITRSLPNPCGTKKKQSCKSTPTPLSAILFRPIDMPQHFPLLLLHLCPIPRNFRTQKYQGHIPSHGVRERVHLGCDGYMVRRRRVPESDGRSDGGGMGDEGDCVGSFTAADERSRWVVLRGSSEG